MMLRNSIMLLTFHVIAWLLVGCEMLKLWLLICPSWGEWIFTWPLVWLCYSASGAVLLCSQECKVLQREAINKNISDLMMEHSVGKQLLLLVLTSIMNVSLAFVSTNSYFLKKCLSAVCRCLSFCELSSASCQTSEKSVWTSAHFSVASIKRVHSCLLGTSHPFSWVAC